jgi:hypothetical protein
MAKHTSVIPAKAGAPDPVVPAKAGIWWRPAVTFRPEIPAFAGMTG